MTVKVSAGSFWLADNTHQEYIGGTSPTIYAPSLPSTAAWIIVTVTADGVLNVVEGTPSASPVLPLPSEYVDELPIAAIYLLQGKTAITSEMIFDIRPLWSVPVDAISQTQLDNFATINWVNNELLAKANVGGTTEPTFILNQGAGTINYSGIQIDRDLLPDVGIRFNENPTMGSPLTPRWEFTNDGITWHTFAAGGALYYTSAQSDALFTPIAHATDTNLHLTAAQNTLLDGLNLPTLTPANINHLTGVNINVQTQLDSKLTAVLSPTIGNIAVLDALGGIVDSGWTLNDAAGSPLLTTDLWSASKIAQEIAVGAITNYVDLTSAQSISGNKSFNNDVVVTGNLTVTGTSTTINTQNLTVDDKNITLNFGYSGVTSGSDGAGITVDRNATGSPAADPTANIIWDDTAERWKAGLDTTENVIALEGVTVAQPYYTLAVGNGGATFAAGWGVPAPASGSTGVQVFVNGIKQVEGAGKAYTVSYANPASTVITFEAGSEPVVAADVEFYGFGHIG